MSRLQCGVAALLTGLVSPLLNAGTVLIDNFGAAQPVGMAAGPGQINVFAQRSDSSILGGQRDIYLWGNSNEVNASEVSGGKLTWSFNETTREVGFINEFVTYDGLDSNDGFRQWDPGLSDGVSGFDMTQGGTNNAFEFDLGTVWKTMFGDMKLIVSVEDADRSEDVTLRVITAADSNTTVLVPFSAFPNTDFQNTRDVQFFFGGSARAGESAYAEVDRFRAVPEPATVLLWARVCSR